ncbi:cytochrome c biogenesis CcdA family protein [Streptomyces sp. ACA25]|uniref:cytochrome c biogenesis CcdA family protein n=1 Tax=Streptomyces sp. ACA25 TaxID=3022596 RepID=UPI002307D4C8|nr:cytochrome c biogenesis CcdA family protein [Streptomyces sp. ACA25]MDB1088674.1 cytochrome c biogenesis CcdA family protein [Streptomyces sp. ACA25]
MTPDIGYAAAFLGGLLTLFSPCSALLLPAFFAYSFGSPSRLLARTVAFWAGLCLTLVPLGVAGSLASRFFHGNRDVLITVGGWTVIALGVAQILGLGFGSRRMQRAAAGLRPSSVPSVVALGAVYGLAGFCAGPILGSVLTISAMGGSPVRGGALLAVYALGMAGPLFLLALVWDRYDLGRRRWLRGRAFTVGRLRLHTVSLLSGVFFILIGVVFLRFSGTAALPGLLGADREVRLEQWAHSVGSAVSDTGLLLALAAVLAVALALRLRADRARRVRRNEEASQPEAARPEHGREDAGSRT